MTERTVPRIVTKMETTHGVIPVGNFGGSVDRQLTQVTPLHLEKTVIKQPAGAPIEGVVFLNTRRKTVPHRPKPPGGSAA